MPVRNDDFVQDLRGKAFGKVPMGHVNGRVVFSQRQRGADPAALSELAAYWVLQPNCGLPIKEGQPALVPMQ